MIVMPGATTVALQDAGGCPAGQPACTFTPGTSAIAFTSSGCRTTRSVAVVNADALQLAAPLAGCTLDQASVIAEGEVRTYRLDSVNRQLVRRDEVTGSSAPMLDGVAAFTIVYYADAAATQPIAGLTDAELMRVRLVRLTLRFVAANPFLRIPDLTMVLDVVPRNLEGG